jgi:hypothetical protein
MMKILNKTLLTGGAILISSNLLSAQTFLSDYKGNKLFEVPTTQTAPEISLNKVGVTFGIHPFNTIQYYIMDSNNQRYNTMLKSRELFGNISIFNDNEDEALVFNKNTRISPYFEFGYATTIDELQNPHRKSGSYYTYSVAVFGQMQRLNVYNKDLPSNNESVIKRFSPGARLGLNIFNKDYFAIAFNGSYKREIAVDQLTSYQDITPGFYVDTKVASNGEIDGYLTPVETQHRFRGSVAVPVFWKATTKKLQFIPTPYYSMALTRFNKSTHYAGIGISITTSKIYNRDRTLDRESLKFSDLASITLGWNFLNSADKSNGRFLFVSGTFKFGNLKPAKKAVPQK